MQDQYKEITIAIVAVICLFLTLAGIIIFFLFRYQKKQFQNKRQVGEMQQQFQQEILLSRLEIQEATFNNISREIHDNVGQVLSLAKVQLNIVDQSSQVNKELLHEVKENVGKAMTDLRDIAKSLSGDGVQQAGLINALQQEVDRINRSQALFALLLVSGTPYKFSEQKELIIFRMVQEAIQNILKHSQSKTMEVALNYTTELLELTIHDNGIGFDNTGQAAKGLGLHNIISRAALIGGKAHIHSIVNNGTHVKLTIPYERH